MFKFDEQERIEVQVRATYSLPKVSRGTGRGLALMATRGKVRNESHNAGMSG